MFVGGLLRRTGTGGTKLEAGLRKRFELGLREGLHLQCDKVEKGIMTGRGVRLCRSSRLTGGGISVRISHRWVGGRKGARGGRG